MQSLPAKEDAFIFVVDKFMFENAVNTHPTVLNIVLVFLVCLVVTEIRVVLMNLGVGGSN